MSTVRCSLPDPEPNPEKKESDEHSDEVPQEESDDAIRQPDTAASFSQE